MQRSEVIKDYNTHIKRFNVNGRKIEFKIKSVPKDTEPVGWIKGAVKEILQHAASNLSPDDKLGITFCGKSFEERGPGWINFRNASELQLDDVWEMISKIFQSNSDGLSTDTFCLGVTSVQIPKGRGRNNKYNTFNEECAMRRGIITIDSKDNLCLPRALVVAIANIEKDPEYKKIRKANSTLQTERASALINDSRIEIPETGCGIPELRSFENYLSNYKIVVYQYGTKGHDVIFEGVCDGKVINLLYHTGHYNVITSLTAAFCCSYYCENCHVPYNVKKQHRCGGTCPQCQKSPKCPKDSMEILCECCNRSFRGIHCFNNHKAVASANEKSICDKIKRCCDCFKTYPVNRKHLCGEYFCKMCRNHVPQEHLCFIQPDKHQPLVENVSFIFYDLESRQEKMINDRVMENGSVNSVKQHEPNLCVFQQLCDKCLDENLYFCQKCKYRLSIKKDNVIYEFMNHILKVRKEFKKVIVIAHNGQSYDHQFILNYILQNTNLKPKLIMRGTKIILMQIENVKFIDSLNYLPMALSKLPKAFDLSSSLQKGYFPYIFNTKQNENYIGSLPQIKYYAPNTMKSEERDAFFKWYDAHKNNEFNMQRDMLEYCINDVKILTEACLKFRKLFLDQCKVDPFVEATTIASACNLVFRRNFLKAETIGLIPNRGYRYADNQSTKAVQWLIWEENKRGINIQHAAKEREAVVAGIRVDGFSKENNQIFEFQGCYYHGHPSCLKNNRDQPLHDDHNDTLNQRYERTVAKINRLKDLKYEIIEIWECEFDKLINSNKEMEYLKTHPIIQQIPLNPRDAFYGGRTGNVYSYYKCKENEKIKYVDICSLYPWVCKYGKFPISHPKVHVGNLICSKLDLNNINGVMKCKILPPEQLLHPVLPTKQNNKLMFTLCRKCSYYKNQEEICPHTDDERALTGTWIVDEVLKAIEKGYKLLEIFEIWEYNIIQYDKSKKSGGLFTEMMNKFIKLKQEASGWPKKCVTNEDKDNYIKCFQNIEDIELDFPAISNNPGKRSLAKLMLNSFWGKFGQRENLQKTVIVNNPAELYELLTNPAVEVCHIFPINEQNIVVNWQYKEDAADSLSTVNVCIAAYTTTQARLKLYNYLEMLGNRVLYYDTDSVIYISREGEFEPPTGDYIGDMTDELECYGIGSYITEFVSGGPKNYAYKVYSTKDQSEKNICKVKGITLNHSTSQKVNFDTIKEAVLNADDYSNILVFSQNIQRTPFHEVITVPQIKKYQPKAEKRRFVDDYSSVPYGYKRHCLE